MSTYENLIKNKKLAVILDLDNTLLDCIQIFGPIKVPNSEQFLSHKNTFYFKSEDDDHYFAKFRPYIKEFFEKINPCFEIYINTLAHINYAYKIVNYIKEITGNLIDIPKERIIAREFINEQIYTKNINSFLKDFAIIVDDRPDVWVESSQLVLNINPYIFFLNPREDESFNDNHSINLDYLLPENDSHLLIVSDYLIQIHQEFYATNLLENEFSNLTICKPKTLTTEELIGTLTKKNTLNILKKFKKRTFTNCYILFTGFETFVELLDYRKKIINFGGKFENNLTQNTTHIVLRIFDEYLLKKMKKLQNEYKNILFVSFNWFVDSIFQMKKMEESLYPFPI